jgi:hypothetical protein
MNVFHIVSAYWPKVNTIPIKDCEAYFHKVKRGPCITLVFNEHSTHVMHIYID